MFLSVSFFGRKTRTEKWGSPQPLLWDQPLWVGLLHVSTALLRHLLPLTFRPTPHTLFPQRMLHVRGHSKTRSPLLQGISPGVIHVLCMCVFLYLCESVCPLPGDSRRELKGKSRVDSESLNRKSPKNVFQCNTRPSLSAGGKYSSVHLYLFLWSAHPDDSQDVDFFHSGHVDLS